MMRTPPMPDRIVNRYPAFDIEEINAAGSPPRNMPAALTALMWYDSDFATHVDSFGIGRFVGGTSRPPFGIEEFFTVKDSLESRLLDG